MVDRGKKQILKQKQPFLNEFETSRLYFLMAFWWSGSSKVLQLSSEDKSSHDFLVYCIFLFKAFMGTKVFIGVSRRTCLFRAFWLIFIFPFYKDQRFIVVSFARFYEGKCIVRSDGSFVFFFWKRQKYHSFQYCPVIAVLPL